MVLKRYWIGQSAGKTSKLKDMKNPQRLTRQTRYNEKIESELYGNMQKQIVKIYDNKNAQWVLANYIFCIAMRYTI